MLVSIEALTVCFDGRNAVEDLSIAIPPGKVYALLGGNGAGKTTTLNVVLGFVRPSSGRVLIDGDSPHRNPAVVREKLAYLPENVALYPYLSGRENLSFFCSAAGIALSRDRTGQLLLAAGLQSDAHDRRISGYSKGMRQKVGLAIAYAKHAKVLLLDEPTSGLDPGAANDFARRVRQAADQGMAVLMATHDLFNAKQVADRIGIMQRGRLLDEFDARTVDHDELENKYLVHAREAAT